MTYPISTSSVVGLTIVNSDYNNTFDIINEVIGTGEDGYGLVDYFSFPVNKQAADRALSWQYLHNDLIVTAYQHITGNTGTILPPSTSTVISSSFNTDMAAAANYVWENRFTCAENQYFADPTTGVSINTTGGVSTRTTEWGTPTNTMTHIVSAYWPTRLIARYFFNAGGYLTWTPYHNDIGYNQLDTAWAEFINYIQNDQIINPLTYDRTTFISHAAGTTTTVHTYSSGSLSTEILAFKSLDEKNIDLTINFVSGGIETISPPEYVSVPPEYVPPDAVVDTAPSVPVAAEESPPWVSGGDGGIGPAGSY